MKTSLSRNRILVLSALLCLLGVVMVVGLQGTSALAQENTPRFVASGYLDNLHMSVQAPDDSERPSAPGQWEPPKGVSEGEIGETTPDFKAITIDDLFTDEGVVINIDYMEWYIQNVMAKKDPMLMAQSNPYAYIEGNEYYRAILDKGPAALPELEKAILDSPNGGLSVYLFAQAIETNAKADMLGILGDPYAISSGREFIEAWTPIKEHATEDVWKIAFSKEYDEKQKLEMIDNYGVLAVPAIVELERDPNLDSDLREKLGKRREFLAPTEKQVDFFKDYLKIK